MTADPGLALLTAPSVGELLRAALSDGEQLVGWRVRSVDHRPRTGTTVGYDAEVAGPGGTTRQILGASAGPGTKPTAWRFPHDPRLPALATAVDEGAVADLLTSCGVAAGRVRLQLRSYRPGWRAVVEVAVPGGRLFLKVLRPQAIRALHERHVLLRAARLPVARSLGWSERGLIVLEGLPGRTLRACLGSPGALPTGEHVLELLDLLPRQVCDLPLRRSWTDEVQHYAAVTGGVLPAEAERCRQLAARIAARTAGAPAGVPTHGDVYEAQLLLEGPRISGLLDVDTVGPGRRADDLACLLAHLSVLAQLERPEHRPAAALREAWLPDFTRTVDPADLRARVAGVLVSLATGPHRVQQPAWRQATRERLDLAEQWLDRVPARR